MERNCNIVLFDGICNLCNGIVKFIIKKDKKDIFIFAPLQSASGQLLLHKYGSIVDKFDTIIYIKEDKYFIKSNAVLNILKDLGNVWKLFFVLIIIPKFFRDFVYKFFAKRRYIIFGKSDTCMVPTPDIKRKFWE